MNFMFSKLINFLKTNFFIKGLIFLGIGIFVMTITSKFTTTSSLKFLLPFYAIGIGLYISALIFFIISLIKETIIFKTLSGFFTFWLIIILAYIGVFEFNALKEELKYNASSLKEITEEYNKCVQERERQLNEQSLKQLLEESETLRQKYSTGILDLNQRVIKKTISIEEAYEKLILLNNELLKREELMFQYFGKYEEIHNIFVKCLGNLLGGKHIFIK